MNKPASRSIFTSPVIGTIFLAAPGVLLLVLSLFFGNFWVRHALSLFSVLFSAPLVVMLLLALLLLLLAGVTVVRAGRTTEPRPPSRGWALLPLVVGLSFLGIAAYVAVTSELFFFDRTDPRRLQALQAADLRAPAASAVPAGDWPQWLGPSRNAISTETGLNTNWNESPPKLLWKKPLHGGYSSIAVAAEKLFISDRDHDHERVVCLDAATGEEIWVYRYPSPYGRLEYGQGPRATPTVFDGRVYTVGATGKMLCVEATPADAKGRLLWEHDLMAEFDAQPPRWGVACSPLIEGSLVIVQPGGKNASVVAFDRVTGEVVWRSLSDISGYSSPVAAEIAGLRQVVCLTGAGLAGLRPQDGQQLWYYPWQTQFEANIATPLVVGNYVFISSDYSKGCALLEITAEGGRFKAEPVYVKSNKLMRNHHSTCVLHEGYLYGSDDMVGSSVFKCVDLRSGEQRWGERIGKCSLLYADGHLIILNENGVLMLVEATPDGFRQKGKLEVFDSSQTWALPSLANGRLYLRNGREVRCYDLKQAAGKP